MNITGLGYGYLSGFTNYISGAVSSLAKSATGLFTGSVAKTSEADIVALHDDDKPREKCGVFAYFSKDHKTDLGNQLYKGLIGIQHRGQDSCGMSFNKEENGVETHNGKGLVNEVFNKDNLGKFAGNFGIAHTLYSTTGVTFQPITVGDGDHKISLAHNGNLSNLKSLKSFLSEKKISCDPQSSDSEMMAKAIQYFVKKESKTLEDAVHAAAKFFIGSYSLLVMDKDKIVALRDPFANRPFSLAKVPSNSVSQPDFILCSETSALNSFHAEFIRDIAPGELLVIDKNTTEESLKQKPKIIFEKIRDGLCPLEYIYLMKPNSSVQYSSGQKSISEIRREFGKNAAKIFRERFPNKDIDYVLPVPQSGVPAATGFAQELKVPINPALIKNFHRRTFLDNGDAVENKFSVVPDAIKDKKVVLVDDSVIRGKTMKGIIHLLKATKPKEIHVVSASPQVHYPNRYGVNIASTAELIAPKFDGDLKKIAKELDVDSITYLDLERFKKALGEKETVDKSIFSGKYKLKEYAKTYIAPNSVA